MNKKFKLIIFAFSLLVGCSAHAWESSIVYYEDGQGGTTDGRLTYVSDEDSNHVPDFSHAGYQGGGVALPSVSVVTTISPIAGDNTQHIQDALDNATTPGAVLLQPGDYYDVSGPIYVNRDGLVLRGVVDSAFPDDETKSTIIRSTATNPTLPDQERTVLVVGGGNIAAPWPENPDTVLYPQSNITTSFIPVGSRCFEVADASGFSVGDNIIVTHPSTTEWITAVDEGGVVNDPPWQPTTSTAPREQFFFNRYITNIDGNVITIDVPLYNHMDLSLSQSYIYKYDRANIKTEIGVEDLQVTTTATVDLDHAYNLISLFQAEDCWLTNVNAQQYIGAGFFIRNGSRLTLDNCKAKTTLSDGVTGGARYSFEAFRASNNILFKECLSEDARHAFIPNGTTAVSGMVVLDCASTGDYLAYGGHRKWSMGLLYDNLQISQPDPSASSFPYLFAILNRGDEGGSHGWASAHSVAWGVSTPSGFFQVNQQPPTAQNYSIGSNGSVIGTNPYGYPGGPGFIEPAQGTLHPRSLYEAQLAERLQYGVAPSSPTITSVTNSSGDLIVTWLPTLDVPVSDLVYLVERSDNGGNSYSEIATVSGAFTDFTDSTAVGAVLYRLRAKNTSTGNRSAYSNDFSATASSPSYRYVRLYAPGGQSYYRIDLKEIRVYEEGSSTNIAKNKPATASSYRSNKYGPWKAVDGKTRTYWSAYNNGQEQWLEVDLQSDYLIEDVDILPKNYFPPVYEVQLSQDGTNWVTFP